MNPYEQAIKSYRQSHEATASTVDKTYTRRQEILDFRAKYGQSLKDNLCLLVAAYKASHGIGDQMRLNPVYIQRDHPEPLKGVTWTMNYVKRGQYTLELSVTQTTAGMIYLAREYEQARPDTILLNAEASSLELLITELSKRISKGELYLLK